MLDPSWAWTRPLLWVAAGALVTVLIIRSIRKDRREYQRFKRYGSTARRQRMFRRWLLESFVQFGGLFAILLLLAGFAVAPLLAKLVRWPGVSDLRRLLANSPEISAGVIIGAGLGLTLLTLFGAREARKDTALVTIGDISAMLPRNRQELVWGGLLSINAGVVEELMFRLAVPALIFGASDSSIAAVVFSVLLFGALHIYQGIVGIIGTTIIGASMMLLYAVTGTIVIPMIVHAVIDLRSLVIIPMAVHGVQRIDGVQHPFAETLVPMPAVAESGPPTDSPHEKGGSASRL